MQPSINEATRAVLVEQLAPHGRLRAGINMSNFLLVSASDEQGAPDGVSPGMARAIAEELGVELELVPFKGPGDVADAAENDQWDIANIAAEAERARVIRFSPAYCEIQATYLIPPDSSIKHINEVDAAGHRIAVKERSAYDLWLSDNVKQATLIRTASLDDSFTRFKEDGLEVLAGLRPKLLEQQALMPGSTVFDDSFTAVQQSIGCKPANVEAAAYLRDFIQRSKESGLISSLIDRYGVTGQLSVAS